MRQKSLAHADVHTGSWQKEWSRFLGAGRITSLKPENANWFFEIKFEILQILMEWKYLEWILKLLKT